MIYIKVALWPGGRFRSEKILGEATIINISDFSSPEAAEESNRSSSYSVKLSKRGGFKASAIDLVENTKLKNVYSSFIISGHKRKTSHFWKLISKVFNQPK